MCPDMTLWCILFGGSKERWVGHSREWQPARLPGNKNHCRCLLRGELRVPGVHLRLMCSLCSQQWLLNFSPHTTWKSCAITLCNPGSAAVVGGARIFRIHLVLARASWNANETVPLQDPFLKAFGHGAIYTPTFRLL